MNKKANIAAILLGIIAPITGVIVLTQYAIAKGVPGFFAYLISVAAIFGVLKVIFRF